jgi:hypothetical protein
MHALRREYLTGDFTAFAAGYQPQSRNACAVENLRDVDAVVTQVVDQPAESRLDAERLFLRWLACVAVDKKGRLCIVEGECRSKVARDEAAPAALAYGRYKGDEVIPTTQTQQARP